MDFKYKIKGEELYIFVDFGTELSNEFLENAKKRLSNLNKEVNVFAKKIGFDGRVAKVIIQGVLIATIALVEVKSLDVSDLVNRGKDENLTDLLLDDVRFSKLYRSLFYEAELDINKYFLSSDSKKYGEPMNPTYIVIHNTANSSSAYNEINYLHSSTNTTFVSFHFAVDENEIWQALPEDVNGWHAGDGSEEDSYNRNSIAIEIARSTIHDDSIKDEAVNNAAKLAAYLMVKHDIPIENVITHHDVSGKYCPHDIFDRYGWDNFIELVNSYLY
ncbi:N-acetylmuramoyl-L-alanine amidase [Mycoplasmatota bacterium WC44]